MNTIIKISLFFILSLLSIQTMKGQNSGIREIENDTRNDFNRPSDKVRIGYTFSALLNSFVGLQMNGAINLNNDMQVNMEAGWIFASSDNNITAVSGYRVRPAIRWYFTEDADYRLHLSLAYNIRKTTAQKIGSFITTDGISLTNVPYEQEQSLKGLAVLFGMDYWLNDRFLIDLGVGIGNGNLLIEDNKIPPNSTRSQFLFSTDSPGEKFHLIAILNIKFQYAF